MRVAPMTEDWRRAIAAMTEESHESTIDQFLLEFGSRHRYVETAEDRAENFADGIPDRDAEAEVAPADNSLVRASDVNSVRNVSVDTPADVTAPPPLPMTTVQPASIVQLSLIHI